MLNFPEDKNFDLSQQYLLQMLFQLWPQYVALDETSTDSIKFQNELANPFEDDSNQNIPFPDIQKRSGYNRKHMMRMKTALVSNKIKNAFNTILIRF